MREVAAVLALLTWSLLPGISLIPLSRDRFLERLGSVCAISVGVNSFVVMLLVMAGRYHTSTAWAWTIAVAVLSAALYLRGRKSTSSPVGAQAIVESPRDRGPAVWLTTPIFLFVAYRGFLLPFFTWDAVASWNRWARNFFLDPGYFSKETFFYPQYMSWGISFPYVLAGDPTLEYIAHGFSMTLVLVLYAGVSRMARSLNLPPTLPFVLLFLTFSFSAYAGTGYADIGASGFSALAMGLFLSGWRHTGPVSRGADQKAFLSGPGRAGFLAGLAAATGFLFKQSALPPVIFVVVFAVLLAPRSLWWWHFKRIAALAAGTLVIAAPWLLSFHTTLTGAQFYYVAWGHRLGQSWLQGIESGLDRLIMETTSFRSWPVDLTAFFVAIALCLLGARQGRRQLAVSLSILAGVVLWVFTANYDTRGLMPTMVAAAIICSGGLEGLGSRIAPKLGVRALSVAAALCVIVFVAVEYYPNRLGDWKQGGEWTRTKAFSSRTEKLDVLQPVLADVERWKGQLPEVSGKATAWSDPLIRAAIDPWKVDGGGSWIEYLETGGRVLWKPGDYLLVSIPQRSGPKRHHAIIDSLVGGEYETWGPWLDQAVAAGVLEVVGSYPSLTVYRVEATVRR